MDNCKWEMGNSHHPLIPVSVTPWMKYFWAKKKMM